MSRKIFWSILLVAAAVLAVNLVIVLGCFYDYDRVVQENQMKDELRLAAYAVEEYGQDYLEKIAAKDLRYTWTPNYRLTWIAAGGSVLFDTSGDSGAMENHGSRDEVREAFAKGESSSVRYSSTLTERSLYYARLLNDGTVLRISISQATVLALVMVMLQPILLAGFLAVILSAVLAHRAARSIVQPLDTLDLDRPMENDTYEELTPLLRRIQQQHGQIAAQLRTLQKKTDELEQITRNMNEGLVLLDNKGTVLSINPAAQKIFSVGADCAGRDLLAVDRSRELSGAVLDALERGCGEVRLTRGGREFQCGVSRIDSDGAAVGTVLLVFDVTERAAAERRRRELTANVSHELKTPLQSILGSAELLENGVVRQEDVPQFAGLIRTEAARLVVLVDDIIHLSQLDEGMVLDGGPVDLREVAEEAVAALQGNAEAKHVHMTVSGSGVVQGVKGLLYELVYDLCDNAVKYNVEGGTVGVIVSHHGQGTAVTVRDSGIGIAEEFQERVFERFFRVDKSRSKASGGTGLGLSIVKHIAQYHHASIRLESQTGVGTEITVTFPDEN